MSSDFIYEMANVISHEKMLPISFLDLPPVIGYADNQHFVRIGPCAHFHYISAEDMTEPMNTVQSIRRQINPMLKAA